MPGDPVNGRPGFWLPDDQRIWQYPAVRLAWQWAPDAWVFVAVTDTDDRDLTAQRRQRLRELAVAQAQALTIGRGVAVTSPFRVPAPDCARPVSTDLYRGTHANGAAFVRFGVMFARGDLAKSNLLTEGSVTADSIATPADKPGSATSTVDGHPAAVPTDNVLIVYDVAGFALEISVIDGGRVDTEARFRSIEMVPGADQDESRWVTDFIR
ncbi:hypothetical protein ACFQX7_28445 [Luedemannella flava]